MFLALRKAGKPSTVAPSPPFAFPALPIAVKKPSCVKTLVFSSSSLMRLPVSRIFERGTRYKGFPNKKHTPLPARPRPAAHSYILHFTSFIFSSGTYFPVQTIQFIPLPPCHGWLLVVVVSCMEQNNIPFILDVDYFRVGAFSRIVNMDFRVFVI